MDGGEKKLILAVILSAIKDYHAPESKLMKAEAETWIFSNKIYPFSFQWCLQALYPESNNFFLADKIRDYLKSGKDIDEILTIFKRRSL